MESRTPEERRARFLTAALPIGMVSLFAVAVGSFLAITWMGGSATGERVEMRWSSQCAEQWATVARARSEEMGLGDLQLTVEGDETVLVATLPGNEDDLSKVPGILAGDGQFAVYAAESLEGPTVGEPIATNEDITSVWFNIDYSGHAYTQIELQPNARKRLGEGGNTLVFLVDGVIVSGYEDVDAAEADDLRLQDASAEAKEDEVRSAIDWKILVQHGPAPCERSEVQVTPLTPGS